MVDGQTFSNCSGLDKNENFLGYQTVYVVGSEADVSALTSMGMTETILIDTEKKRSESDLWDCFIKRDVIIIEDNDEIGRALSEEVTKAIKKFAKSVTVIPIRRILKKAPQGADISCVIERCGLENAKKRFEDEMAITDPTYMFHFRAKQASEYGEDDTQFLWYPYLPIGDYSVLMAAGGTGKTFFCCAVAAFVSKGIALPGDDTTVGPERVLIISAEDTGEILKKRLENSGANLDNVLIIDCKNSEDMNFTNAPEEFEQEIMRYGAKLVIIDPWHAFLGADIDINRVNCVRPVFQKIANMAKRCNCAFLLVSHVNKRAQGENANNAATGSADFINASRSAMQIVCDESKQDVRYCVHTKSNYAPYGRTIIYRIHNDGVVWDGFSDDITKATLEQAARMKKTVSDIKKKNTEKEEIEGKLIEAVAFAAQKVESGKVARFMYEEFKASYGESIFGSYEPKRILDSIKDDLSDNYGIKMEAGILIKHDGRNGRGFSIMRVPEDTEE